MVYLQFLYMKKFSHKFSISSNICPRNYINNPNLSQRCFDVPNRRHVSLARWLIVPTNVRYSLLADTICLTLFGMGEGLKRPLRPFCVLNFFSVRATNFNFSAFHFYCLRRFLANFQRCSTFQSKVI